MNSDIYKMKLHEVIYDGEASLVIVRVHMGWIYTIMPCNDLKIPQTVFVPYIRRE